MKTRRATRGGSEAVKEHATARREQGQPGDRHGDEVWTWLIDPERAESCRQPWLDRPISGAGDLLAALFVGYWLRLGAPGAALPAAVTRVSEMIDASGGSRDIDVVAGLGTQS